MAGVCYRLHETHLYCHAFAKGMSHLGAISSMEQSSLVSSSHLKTGLP